MAAPPPAITISNTLTQVSCGSSSNVWGVDAAGNIYQYQSSDGGKTWTQTQINGTLQQVSVGADGTVWGVQANSNIFQYGGGGAWYQIGGTLAQISVGSASHIWGVQANGNIFQYGGGGAWYQIPGHPQASNTGNNGPFTLVAVGSANVVFALDTSDPNGSMYWYLGASQTPAWQATGGTGITCVSVASDRTFGMIYNGVTTIQVGGVL